MAEATERAEAASICLPSAGRWSWDEYDESEFGWHASQALYEMRTQLRVWASGPRVYDQVNVCLDRDRLRIPLGSGWKLLDEWGRGDALFGATIAWRNETSGRPVLPRRVEFVLPDGSLFVPPADAGVAELHEITRGF